MQARYDKQAVDAVENKQQFDAQLAQAGVDAGVVESRAGKETCPKHSGP
jgi:hypothetical protein